MRDLRLLAIFAPYPREEYRQNGWYRRIYLVDKILDGIPRIYLNTIHSTPFFGTQVVEHVDGVFEIFLHGNQQKYSKESLKFLERVSLAYIHTTHLGRDFIKTELNVPFLIDFHGIAPEEEEIQGNLAASLELGEIEKALFLQAHRVIYVSPGMKKHFEKKYSKRESVILPIISDVQVDKNLRDVAYKDRGGDEFIYAGGAQHWQNIDKMMTLVGNLEGNLTVATDTPHNFSKWSETCSFKVGTYNKSDLSKLYLDSKFGFVLRDDSKVNQVSFPTKLFEYLAHGVVPIVDFADLGGLLSKGYQYISTLEIEHFRFNEERLQEIRIINQKVSDEVTSEFILSALELRSYVLNKMFKTY